MEAPVTQSDIESADDIQVVNTILLWRIYDALLLILAQLGGDAGSLGKMHESGEFIGPNPAVSLEDDDGSGE